MTPLLPIYLIRQPSTGRYLPAGKGKNQATSAEFSSLGQPRVFTCRRAALTALGVWLKGHKVGVEGRFFTSPSSIRKEDDVEIVELQVELP